MTYVFTFLGCSYFVNSTRHQCGEPADCTVFSFNGNKTVTLGGGGAIITENEEISKSAKHISTTVWISPEYDFDMVGYNYRMINIQAAVGCAQLERVEEFVNKKEMSVISITDY